MKTILGIDLGTTYSAVAVHRSEEPEIIPDSQGRTTLPSVVAFTPEGPLAGYEALGREWTDPESVIRRVKRKMGTDTNFRYGGEEFSPEEVSSEILKKLKLKAENFLGEAVADAIITVPAYFNDSQRQATKNAGRLAGLNVLRIINEPTAAALAYGVRPEEELNLVVYDLGGGTFDVSVLTVGGGIFEVLATAGDNNLGGEDFTRRLVELAMAKFRDETGIELASDPLALAQLSAAAEEAKIELSHSEKAVISVPFIAADEKGTHDLEFELTRADFEAVIRDYLDRTLELTRQAVSDSHLELSDIDRILLVGGSSRIPKVREGVKELFGKEADTSSDPEEAVARGAALQGAIVGGDLSGIVLVDVNPISLGIEVENGYFVPIIERNTPIPMAARRIFTTVADSQKSVEVHVMQGESMYSKNNVSLGKFRLEGIRSALKGEPRIEVTFEMDVNGILHVSAFDMETHSTQGITIVEQGRMSEEELKRVQEAHSSRYENEIRKRGVLTSVLKMKTRAENLASKIQAMIPPSYQNGIFRSEIGEILTLAEESLAELDVAKMERVISRLEFIQNELNAGSFSEARV